MPPHPTTSTNSSHPPACRKAGLFEPAAVGRLVQKIQQGQPIGESDDMALVGIISTQLVHAQFVKDFRPSPPLDGRDNVKIRSQSQGCLS